ncbi:MAG: acetate/propionate family kinase [Pseudomonadota bacterium]
MADPSPTDAILTLNAGSSSVKFALFTAEAAPRPLLTGQLDGIGTDAHLKVKRADGTVVTDTDIAEDDAPDPGAALKIILRALDETRPRPSVVAVGHRIVHGGVDFAGPVILDDTAMASLDALTPFAPLHQPHNLAGVYAARAMFPAVPQIGCFDTAFHRTHPWVNDTFALPRMLYDQGVRRFGFHGLSYEYISQRLDQIAPLYQDGNVIVAHLGNGASMCAIRDGQSVGSTMGFSALDGLPMGTRCGQLDPGVVLYLMDQLSMDAAQIEQMLYRESGLLGLSGETSDMRRLLVSQNPAAAEALDYYVTRIRREIGAMTAILGGLDAVVFTGGIGENAFQIRQRVCQNMTFLGLELDAARNRHNAEVISSDRSRVRLFVIPTNEQLMIAQHVWGLVA